MNAEGPAIDWIAVDWGTSNLRAWAMADGAAVAKAESAAGMAGLARDEFEPALIAVIGDWLVPGRVTDAVACGMVGSRQGWIEAPYARVPSPPPCAFVRPVVADVRLRVHVLPGMRQDRPWDVMRGEETQISGLIAAEPQFDGVACLPGTHTKWAHVSAGEIVSFASAMTGEIFALLSRSSVLRHSVGPGWAEADFREAVDETLSHPERLTARLFGIRAESLLDGLAPERARARLSGLLIGAELAAMRPYWLGREIVVIGAASLTDAYVDALALCGVPTRRQEATAMTVTGLGAAHHALIRQRTLQ
jgi:2-dehydro-3-deoxygalactonokinase